MGVSMEQHRQTEQISLHDFIRRLDELVTEHNLEFAQCGHGGETRIVRNGVRPQDAKYYVALEKSDGYVIIMGKERYRYDESRLAFVTVDGLGSVFWGHDVIGAIMAHMDLRKAPLRVR